MRSQIDRVHAENLFVRDGKSIEEIAAATGISKGALGKWSKAGGWVQKRAERNRESPQVSIDKLKRQRELQIGAIGEGAASAEQIDSLYKLNLLIEKMEAGSGAIGPMLDVMGRFAEFVMREADDVGHVEVIREWIEKFLAEERRKNA
jgi:hypothetical protein